MYGQNNVKDMNDGRYLIELKGLIRFQILKEIIIKNIENVKLIIIIIIKI